MRGLAFLAIGFALLLSSACGGCDETSEMSLLGPPSRISATAEPGAIVVDWNANEAHTYRVYYALNAEFAADRADVVDIESPPFVHERLRPSLQVFYRVSTVDGEIESELSEEVSATVPAIEAPGTPVGVTADVVAGRIEVGWEAVDGATNYRIYVSEESGGGTNGILSRSTTTSWDFERPTPGQEYFFVVVAENAAGASDPSEKVSAGLPAGQPPTPPDGLAVQVGDRRATAQWDPSERARGYRLYLNEDPDVELEDAVEYSAATTPLTLTGLRNGVPYRVRVVAWNDFGSSAPSDAVDFTPTYGIPVAPTNLNVSSSVDLISLQWEAVEGAENYNVYWSTSAGVTPANGTSVDDVRFNRWSHAGLGGSETYYYVITAENQAGESNPSIEVSATTSIDSPTLNSIAADPAAVSLDWTLVDGATSYDLHFKAGASLSPLDLGTVISDVTPPYSHVGYPPAAEVFYRVIARTSGGASSLPSNELSVQTSPPPVSNASAQPVSGGIQITWDAVAEADGYVVYYDTSPGVTPASGMPLLAMQNQVEHTGLTDGQTYYYVVVATRNGTESAPSSVVSATATVPIPGAVTNLVATPQDGGISLAWDAEPSADSYTIYWSNVTGVTTASSSLGPVTSPTFTHTGLTNGTTYYYMVVAANSSGTGPASTEVSGTPQASMTPVVAFGDFHTVVALPNGNVWAWGESGTRLGDGSLDYSTSPTRVNLGFTAVALDGGYRHTLAIASDSTLYAWGRNGDGQLGQGGTAQSAIPVQVKDSTGSGNLQDIVAIAAGESHSLALDSSGNVWSWGSNGRGELGRAGTTDLPGQVLDSSGVGTLSGIVAIAAGEEVSFAISSTGTLYGWGQNRHGQLGINTEVDASVPMVVSATMVFDDVDVLSESVVARTGDGGVWVWGNNRSDRLGFMAADTCAPGSCQKVPHRLTGLDSMGIESVHAGGEHFLAQSSTGLWSWGLNWLGHAGVGHLMEPLAPTEITSAFSPSTIGVVGAGYFHSIAWTTDNKFWSWGGGNGGVRGDGTSELYSGENTAATPTQFFPRDSGRTVTEVAAGFFSGQAVTSTGTLISWGSQYGLGVPSTQDEYVPVEVNPAGVGPVSELCRGTYWGALIDASGAVFVFGGVGAPYGDATTTESATANPVDLSPLPAGVVFDQIACGSDHLVARANDGTVWAWGYNGSGQVGNGVTTNAALPAQVCVNYDTNTSSCTSYLTGVGTIAAGDEHSLALDSTGVLWAWGEDSDLQLGVSPSGNRAVATMVDLSSLPAGVSIVDFDGGWNHTVVLGSDAELYSWGGNFRGQLGRGTTSSTGTLAAVNTSALGAATPVNVHAGRQTSFLIDSNGAVWAWGDNSEDQLGGNYTYSGLESTPVQVLGLGNVVITEVSFQQTFVLAVDSQGRAWSWGSGSSGELGDGATWGRAIPRRVSQIGGWTL